MTPTPKHQKQHDSHASTVMIGHTVIGLPNQPVVMAGPCAVESYEQLKAVGETLVETGIPLIRGGAFKPRTSPYAFQGLGEEGLKHLARIREELGLGVVTEVMAIEQIALMRPYVDCFQVGSRNMQNFDLLKALGKESKPVLLKRGLAATLDEFLNAAEYILAGGNHQVILCERGIRSFDSTTRNVLDLAGVAYLKQKTHLPVVVDPSHATGVRDLILPAARAAIAIGADGLLVEAHPQPDQSVSDAAQALPLEALHGLMHQVQVMSDALAICRKPLPSKVTPIHSHAQWA
ncbi:MAG: bifunctional 3-deoxy-7-phosphoheptulonate synthase/chorismate mutase [Vampirovibrionales bacterium]